MKLYIYSNRPPAAWQREIKKAIHLLSGNTDTSDVYIMTGSGMTRGTAYVRDWKHPGSFRTGRSVWGFTKHFPLPDDLPKRFKLIRLLIALDRSYPRQERDIYYWRFSYTSIIDHVALLFAHELHHFRRHHLGLHPRQGEQGANRWALEMCSEAGYDIRGERMNRLRIRKKRMKIRSAMDPYRIFRPLQEGDTVFIRKDPSNQYSDQYAHVIRPIRLNSKRMVIRTADGKIWRWPMIWLGLIKDETSVQ